MTTEAEEGPITRLVYAILLSALHKRASDIAIRRIGTQGRVDFLIAGQEVEEIRPPPTVLQGMVRKLIVMASLPTHAKGQHAEGTIALKIGDDRDASFAIRVEGHGDTLAAYLHVLSDSRSPGGG